MCASTESSCTRAAEPGGHGAGDHVGVEVDLRRQQALTVLVALADDPRGMRRAVEGLLERGLDERALLFDHDDLLEAARELVHDLALERPDHAELEDSDAGALELGRAETEAAQGVDEVVVGLAGRDDAEPRVAGALDPVDAILAGVRERELGAHAEHRSLHLERLWRKQMTARLMLIAEIGQHREDAPGRHLGGADRVGHARDDLEAGPQPGGARAGVGVQAEIHDLLDAAREEDRHVQRGEQRLGRARNRRGLAGGVVAHDGEAAAGARDAHEVAVAQRVRRAIEAGSLAVPHAEHAVVLRAGQVARQLAAPGGGGPELLVQARDVPDVVLVEQLAIARELLVKAPERRALIARDHRAGRQARAAVGAMLVEHHAHEPLDAGEEDAALVEDVLVLK